MFGVGFVSAVDEDHFLLFLNNCPSKFPFIEGELNKYSVFNFHFKIRFSVDDFNSQPDILKAPNQRVFRTKVSVYIILSLLSIDL